MKFQNYLNESRGKLIIVDIQPEYDNACRHLMKKFPNYLENYNDIMVYYVGDESGISQDTKYDVTNYYMDWGVPEEKIEEMTFDDKGYAFFRGWMDTGVDDDDIIKTVKFMLKNRINDSRDIKEKDLNKINDELYSNVDSINIPDIDLRRLKSYNGATIIGGGCDECLAELILMIDALGMRVKKDNRMIY
jgi:hypothetical protein